MGQGWGGQERRESPRVKEAVGIHYRVLEKDEGAVSERFLQAETINISANGLLLVTKTRLSENQSLIMEIIFEKPEQLIQCHGRVVWVKKAEDPYYHVGVEFIRMEAKTSELFKKYVQEILEKDSPTQS